MKQENFMLSHDKANHFVYGVAIAVVVGNIAKYAAFPYVPLIAVGAAVAISIAKEILDYSNGKRPDVADVLLTQLGAVAPFLI